MQKWPLQMGGLPKIVGIFFSEGDILFWILYAHLLPIGQFFECVFITFLWMKCAWCKKPMKCLLCYNNVIFFEWVEHELHIFSLRLFISWSKFLEGSNSYVDFLILSFLKVSFFCQFKFKTKFANLRENNFLKK